MKYSKIFTCIVSISLFLAGCAAPDEEPEQTEYTSLTMFSDVTFWNFPDWILADNSITAEISDRTGVALDVTIPPREPDKKLSLLLHKGELPDIISITDPSMIRQLIDSRKVWQMDEFLTRYCPDSHLLENFPGDMKQEQLRMYGGWYSYPSIINSDDARDIWKEADSYYGDLVRYRQNYGILWNRSLMEQSGLSADDLGTQSEALAAFEKIKSMNLKAGNETVIPLLFEGNDYQASSLGYLCNSFGAEQVDENGNYTERWLQPECKEVLKLANTVFRKGYAYTEHLTLDSAQIRALMASGRAFCYMGNIANTSISPADYITTGPLAADNGNRPVLGMDLTTPTGWIQTFISKDCAYPEQTAHFLDYMTSDEGLLLQNYGLEGEDFLYDENGLVCRTETGMQKASDPANAMGLFWNFYNSAWEHSIIPVPDPGDFISTDSELGRLSAELALFCREQIPKIISASSDTEFEEQYSYFIRHQKKLGIDRLDEKINEQMHKNFTYYGKTIEKVNPP